MATFEHTYLGNFSKDLCRNRKVIALDIESWEQCKCIDINPHIPEVLKDQKLYNQLFYRLSKKVNELTIDQDLFPSCNHPVNPLFITQYQWVAFLGNIAHKMVELAYIREQETSDCLLVESSKKTQSYLPYILYGELIFLHSNSPQYYDYVDSQLGGLTLKQTFLFQLINSFHNFSLIMGWRRNDPKFLLIQNAFSRNTFNALIKSKSFPYCIQISNSVGSEAADLNDNQLTYIFEACASTLTNHLSPEDYILVCRHLYKEFKDLLNFPLKFYKYYVKETLKLNIDSSYELIADASVKPLKRSIQYAMYERGVGINSLEYEDGAGTGLIDNTVVAYRTYGIAKRVFFNGPVGHCSSVLSEEIGHKNSQEKVRVAGCTPKNVPRQCLSGEHVYYVPSAFSGKLRIGTNREYADIVYWDIQQRLLSSLTNRGYKVTYKAHPKPIFQDHTKHQLDWLEEKGIAIEYRKLDDLWSDIPFLISDFLGSGVLDAIRLRRKVILLELGARNVMKEAEPLLKNVVSYIKPEDIASPWEDEVLKALTTEKIITQADRKEFFDFVFGPAVANPAENVAEIIMKESKTV